MGQLGEIRDKLVIEFQTILPDYVMVFGDITSTLAAAIAGTFVKHVTNSNKPEIIHIESGLRSNDLNMPEEVNRILTDS